MSQWNGLLTLAAPAAAFYELGSPDWEAKVKKSKFGVHPKYGRAAKGHFALQGDHEGELTFRNIKVRVME